MKHLDSSPWSIQMATEMRALERARWMLRCLGFVGVLIAAVVGGAWWTDSAGTAPHQSIGVALTAQDHP